MIVFSLSPDLRDIKGTKLECISCQINNILSEAQTSITRQLFYNCRLETVHNQGNKRNRKDSKAGCHRTMETVYSLFQEVLLGSDDGAWPANPDPSNDFSMCKPVVLHYITGYQRSCSSKTSCKTGNTK